MLIVTVCLEMFRVHVRVILALEHACALAVFCIYDSSGFTQLCPPMLLFCFA